MTIDSYVRWCREIVETSTGDTNLLFDNSVEEPTALLHAQIGRSFGAGMGARYRSTFAHGNPYVLDALAARYGVERESITCTTGCSSGMSMIFDAYLEPGSHAIVERPYFEFIPSLALSRGAQVSYIEREGPGYGIDPERLEALIRPQTRLIVLTNLHNPSGALLGDDELRALAAVADRAGVAIVADEVYGDFVTGGTRSGPAAKLSPAFISVNSLTKVYGLFTLKCGWIIASEEARARINAVYDRFEFGLSKLTHALAASVLEDMRPYEAHWRDLLETSRPVMLARIAEMEREGLLSGALPEHGCMYFPRLGMAQDDVAVVEWLWKRHGLAVAPGSFFGAPGHIRVGFGRNVGDVIDGMSRLGQGLREYRGLHTHESASAGIAAARAYARHRQE